MILLEKLFNKYTRVDLERLYDRSYAYELTNYRINPRLVTIAGRIDVVNELGYTYNDFMSDYENYKEYKESKLIFDIFKKGITIKDAAEKFDYNETTMLRYLKSGISLNKGTKTEEIKPYYTNEKVDISNLELKIYDDHCELFGPKKFKSKYDIDEEVLFSEINQEWHIAFTGYWFYLIKCGKVVSWVG